MIEVTLLDGVRWALHDAPPFLRPLDTRLAEEFVRLIRDETTGIVRYIDVPHQAPLLMHPGARDHMDTLHWIHANPAHGSPMLAADFNRPPAIDWTGHYSENLGRETVRRLLPMFTPSRK